MGGEKEDSGSGKDNNKRQLLECVRVFLLLQKVEDLAPIILSRNLPGIYLYLFIFIMRSYPILSN